MSFSLSLSLAITTCRSKCVLCVDFGICESNASILPLSLLLTFIKECQKRDFSFLTGSEAAALLARSRVLLLLFVRGKSLFVYLMMNWNSKINSIEKAHDFMTFHSLAHDVWIFNFIIVFPATLVAVLQLSICPVLLFEKVCLSWNSSKVHGPLRDSRFQWNKKFNIVALIEWIIVTRESGRAHQLGNRLQRIFQLSCSR